MTVADLHRPDCVEVVLKTKPGTNGYPARQEVTYINKAPDGCNECEGDECNSPSGGDIWNS